MNYEQKYLKYKQKYLSLKLKFNKTNFNQLGGAEVTIPNKFPGTYSFLFMPLIYYTLDASSVTLPDGFENCVNECITNSKEIYPDIPFTDFSSFISYLFNILNTNGIKTIETLEKIKDSDHHIPGSRQEFVTNYENDYSINIIISCLANILIERLSGKKFVYNK